MRRSSMPHIGEVPPSVVGRTVARIMTPAYEQLLDDRIPAHMTALTRQRPSTVMTARPSSEMQNLRILASGGVFVAAFVVGVVIFVSGRGRGALYGASTTLV